MYSKPVIFVVISVLVVALIYSSISTFDIFAAKKIATKQGGECLEVQGEQGTYQCCVSEYDEYDNGDKITTSLECATCKDTPQGLKCGEYTKILAPPRTSGEDILAPDTGVAQDPTPPTPRLPTPPTAGESVSPEGGVLEEPPTPRLPTPPTAGESVSPEGGVLEQPPADEGTEAAPRTVEPPSTTDEATLCPEGLVLDEESGLCVLEDCPEGQVLDEESGLCVLEQPEVVEEPEQSEPEEPEQQQPSEEGDGSEDNSNNDDN